MSTSAQLPAFLGQSKAELHAKFIDLEWQQRNRLLEGSKHPANPADPPSKYAQLSGDAVTARNRYWNIQPFAENRVKLDVPPDSGVSDYINASPIVLGKRRYIATQGPKDTSVNHFYRMVASDEIKSPVVVVMLTQTHESGREKCFQYYPLSAEESPLVIPEDPEIADGWRGQVVLESVQVDEEARCEVRHMRLRTTKRGQGETAAREEQWEEKEIHHLLFSGWPDFLVPEGADRTALLSLVRLSAQLNAPASMSNAHTNGHILSATNQENPRIVHCSAGVGRSGTFISLDYLLSLLYAGNLDDVAAEWDPIAETVDLLRQQRMMMVQGEAQFHFLYEVLRERVAERMGVGAVNGVDERPTEEGAGRT